MPLLAFHAEGVCTHPSVFAPLPLCAIYMRLAALTTKVVTGPLVPLARRTVSEISPGV